MSGFVLASIIQDCKARNKCFTSSPQDATSVQGLHFSAHRAQSGAKRGEEGGRKQDGEEDEAAEESVKGVSRFSKCVGKILKMLDPIHSFENSFLPGRFFEDAEDAFNAICS